MSLYRHFLIVFSIMVLAVALRSYRISNPVAEWHSFRSADTISVTREYLKHGIDLLRPRYHDLSDIQSGKDNLEGYRMVEFPIIPAFHAWFISFFGLQEHLVLVERSFSIVYSIGTLVSIYALALLLGGSVVSAVGASIFFAVLPYSVFYGRTPLPDLPATFFSTLAVLFAVLFTKKQQLRWLFALSVSIMLAVLIKPFSVFVLPVVGIILLRSFFKIGFSKLLLSMVLIGLSLVPLLIWRTWITGFPEGIPASDWLYNKNNIRFSGAFLYWILQDRISELILGVALLPVVVLGLIRKHTASLILIVWTSSMLAYLWIFAGGNVQHDYYQIILLPILSLLFGFGVKTLVSQSKEFVSRWLLVPMLMLLSLSGLALSWKRVEGYFNVNRWEIVFAGEAVDRLTPSDAKVVAPYMGDTAFLFQTNRTGWPIGFDLEEKISMGATHFVTVDFDDLYHDVAKRYTLIEKTDRYALFDLTSPITQEEDTPVWLDDDSRSIQEDLENR